MPAITVSIQTTAGALLDGGPDDPFEGIASSVDTATATIGGSVDTLFIPNSGIGRAFQLAGDDFAFAADGTPTGGMVWSLAVRTYPADGSVASYASDTPISLVQLTGAMEQYALGNEAPIDAIFDAFSFTLHGNAGADRFFGADQADSLEGADGADTLGGELGNDTIVGGAGADSLIGGGGLDYLRGGAGADTMRGGADADDIAGGADGDELYGGSAGDLLAGALGNDFLRGAVGNDVLGAGQGNDTLGGGQGDDELRGGLGNDDLTGGQGADRFLFATAGAADSDVVHGFVSGQDVIELDAAFFSGASFGTTLVYSAGNLSFNGALIATFEGAPAIDAGDILVV